MRQSPSSQSESIGGPAKRGIAWALSSNVVIQGFQFAVGVVLARLLLPEDFGVFAITSIFTGLAANIANIGLGAALVQRREISEQHRRTMLATNLSTSSLIVALLILISPWVGRFFQHQLAGPILILVSFNFLINSASSVSFSLLSRALRFRVISIIEASSMVVHALVAITMALRGFGVWSIAWGGIAQSLFRCGALIATGGWAPRLGWSRPAFGDLISFGAALTVKRLLNYCAANVDYFVIGRRLGPVSLGYYTRAYSLMTLPLTQLSRVIMGVLFPAFSRIQDDNERLVDGYQRVVLATALVSFPFLAGLLVTAPVLIGFVYGEKWLPTVAPLQIMCVAGMMKSVSTFVGSIVNAKGQVMAEVRRQAVYLVLLIGGTWLGSYWGTTGVAWAVVGASLIMLIMMQSLLNGMIGMRWRSYLASVWPPLAASGIMALVVLAAQSALRPHLGPHSFALLLVATVIGVVTYSGLIMLVPIPRVVAIRREIVTDVRAALARRRETPPVAVAATGEGTVPAVRASDATRGQEASCQESPESSNTASA
jgi:PST family polysaccharide transporter